MEASLRLALSQALTDAGSTGEPARLAGHRLELADGRSLFFKGLEGPPYDRCEKEAAGLAALAAVGAIRGPRLVAPGRCGELTFLILEQISATSPGHGFFETFGRALAQHHRQSTGDRFGFDHDNYLGATPQPNGWCDDGCQFFCDHRLGFQLALARRRGLADGELSTLGDRLLARLDDWLELPDEPPCLIHGDLWSGNFLVAAGNQPVWIDPAAHWAHREADLAMARLFGGFSPRFFAAYEEAWPLQPGAAERNDLFQLYHLLNHLNLFGGSYREGCLAILRRLV
ncbi:MAG: fructosamine kinase family protein [Acidobacteriota bacterium]